MPDQRAPNRKVTALWLDKGFQEALDKARKCKGMNRSTFIRFAIAEELKRLGIEFNVDEIFAPDRAGKGGRPKKKPPIGPSSASSRSPKPGAVHYGKIKKAAPMLLNEKYEEKK